MIERQLTRRFLVRLWVAAFAIRMFTSLLRPIPAEDGVNYLWMAERFAAGHASLALSEVFPPLWPMCIAPFVAIGFDPFRAGQLAAALAGAFAVIVVVRVTVAVWPRGGFCAACMLVFAPLPVRYGGLVYSEPLFLLLAALATREGLRRSYVSCGVLSGLAFATRPEGALVALAFAIVRPRRGFVALLPVVGCALLLALWRRSVGHGFDPVPTMAFDLAREHHEGLGVESIGNFVSHLARIAWLWFEAFWLVGVLAIIGIVAVARGARSETEDGGEGPVARADFAPLFVMLGLAILVICAFLPRRRFLVSWIFAVVPFAVAGLWQLPKPGRWPTLLVLVVTSLLGSLRLAERDRYAERVVGEHLGARLAPGERVAGDMTRVIYFSGCRPLPPRHFSIDELVARAREPGVRFVVLGGRRPTAAPVQTALADRFEPLRDLPFEVDRAARERGLSVLGARGGR